MTKHTVLVLLLWAVTVSSISAVRANQAQHPRVKGIDDKLAVRKDLGTLAGNSERFKTDFVWTNTRGHRLTIKKILKSCSCLTVTPAEGTIESGEAITFSVKADVGGWYGPSAVKFVPIFNEDAELRIPFIAEFFIKSSLKPLPEDIDFGHVGDPIQSRALFRVAWVVAPDGSGIEFYPNVFSKNGFASCRLVNSATGNTKSPNMDGSQAVKQDFVFEVFLSPDIPTGEFSDLIRIPVRVNGKIEYTYISVKGNYEGQVFSSPANLFWPLKKRGEIAALVLYRQNWCPAPDDLRVSCDNAGLTLVTKMRTVGTSLNQSSIPLADIEIAVNSLDSETDTVEADIQVEYEITGTTNTLTIPVKILSRLQGK